RFASGARRGVVGTILFCLLTRPGSDESNEGYNCFRGCHFGLQPLWKRIEISQGLERKVEALDLRAQTAKEVVAPSCEVRITSERHLQTNARRRHSCFLEDPVKSRPDLRICSRALKRFANERNR